MIAWKPEIRADHGDPYREETFEPVAPGSEMPSDYQNPDDNVTYTNDPNYGSYSYEEEDSYGGGDHGGGGS